LFKHPLNVNALAKQKFDSKKIKAHTYYNVYHKNHIENLKGSGDASIALYTKKFISTSYFIATYREF